MGTLSYIQGVPIAVLKVGFLGHPVQELSITDNYFHDAVLRLGVACQSGLWSVVGEIRS